MRMAKKKIMVRIMAKKVKTLIELSDYRKAIARHIEDKEPRYLKELILNYIENKKVLFEELRLKTDKLKELDSLLYKSVRVNPYVSALPLSKDEEVFLKSVEKILLESLLLSKGKRAYIDIEKRYNSFIEKILHALDAYEESWVALEKLKKITQRDGRLQLHITDMDIKKKRFDLEYHLENTRIYYRGSLEEPLSLEVGDVGINDDFLYGIYIFGIRELKMEDMSALIGSIEIEENNELKEILDVYNLNQKVRKALLVSVISKDKVRLRAATYMARNEIYKRKEVMTEIGHNIEAKYLIKDGGFERKDILFNGISLKKIHEISEDEQEVYLWQ